jgi:hypothetical protein
MRPCSYWVVRYLPSLARDEWVNVGVLLYDPGERRLRWQFIEDAAEFTRVRRLHPNADESLLHSLGSYFDTSVAQAAEPAVQLAELEQVWSNVVQLSPSHGILTEDPEGELDRLYQQHVAVPRRPAGLSWVAQTRAALRVRLGELLRAAGLLGRMERRVSVAEFTYPGDPLRLDYAYRYDSRRGFIHTLPLERDAQQAKVLAYTAERIRSRLGACEFAVVTDRTPEPQNARHQFIAGLLAEQAIELVSLERAEPWLGRLRTRLVS